MKKTEITLPATLYAKNATIKVVVTKGGKETVYEDWGVRKVEREGKKAESFEVVLESDKIKKQKWNGKTTVRIEICDGEQYEPTVIEVTYIRM